PSVRAPISSARCEIDLSPGTAICPTREPAGSTLVTVPSVIRRGAWHRAAKPGAALSSDTRPTTTPFDTFSARRRPHSGKNALERLGDLVTLPCEPQTGAWHRAAETGVAHSSSTGATTTE